jgi:hypothetical protein
MHKLFGANPTVMRSVLAHSQTTVDLGVLGERVNLNVSIVLFQI